VSSTPVRMPDYNPAGRRRFKPLRDRADTTPRVGRILDVEPQLLAVAIGTVLCSGCALLISPTQDGGALSLTLYLGDDRRRDYVSNAEEFQEALRLVGDLAQAYAYPALPKAQKTPQNGSQATQS
jgi:hypothetical protein